MAITKDPDSGKSAEDDAVAKIAAALGASGGTGAGRVFMGNGASAGYVSPFAPTGATGQKSNTTLWMSADDAKADFYHWKPKKQDDFLAKLKVSGLVQEDAGPMEASRIWQALVDESSNYGSQGKEVSPFDLLSRYVKQSGNGNPWKKSADGRFEVNVLTGERRYVGPQFSTVTNQRVDLTDPASARAIAEKMFQDLMGRNPGKGEIGQFASALTEAEQANPLNETVTTQYDTSTGDAIGNSSVSSGGVSADAKAMLAEDQIKKKPEYGALQAATTYQNAFDQLIYGAPQ
jgi:hypothetical protein